MRKEYTHVRLEMPVYDTIKINAFNEKMSVSRYIEKLLSQRLTTVKNEIIIDKERCLGGIANPVFRKELRGSGPVTSLIILKIIFQEKQEFVVIIYSRYCINSIMFSLSKNSGLRKYETVLDILIMLVWTTLTLAFVLTPFLSGTFFRTILGIPMVLFIPGYALTASLFPGKDGLETVERIAMSLGLSIAVVPLLGLLLNFTFGIKLIPILLLLCSYTIVLILVAAVRRINLPEEMRFSVPIYRIFEIASNEINGDKGRTEKILTGILIFSLVLTAGVMFFVIATPKTGERFTEFYILDPSGKADNYPANIKLNSPEDVRVGVVNHEYASFNYSIQVNLDKNILTGISLSLNHNETWEKTMTFVPHEEGTNKKLEFLLFRGDNFTHPYRELFLWVNVTK